MWSEVANINTYRYMYGSIGSVVPRTEELLEWCKKPTTVATTTRTTVATTTRKTTTRGPTTTSKPAELPQKTGFLMAGGYTNQTGRNTYSSAAGVVDSSGRFCELPPVNPRRYAHTMNGLTACGGSGSTSSMKTCVTFNTTSGKWDVTYKLPYSLYLHVSWENSQGILLMGNRYEATANKTLLLLPDGKTKPSFDLVNPTYGACNIEDPSTNSVIMTGGYDPVARKYHRNNVRYGEKGFIEYLPNSTYNFIYHGCAGYYEGKNQAISYLIFIFQLTLSILL